jgi:FkbM family methyltransferase
MYENFHDDYVTNPNYSVGLWFRNNVYKDYEYKGTLLEVGGGDPEYLSFSKHFIMNNWKAYIFEPNPVYAQRHREIGNHVIEAAVSDENKKSMDFYIYEDENKFALGWSSLGLRIPGCKLEPKIVKVPVITLNDFFVCNNIKHIDIVSIDVEGWEPEVVKGFDEKKYSVDYFVLEVNGPFTEHLIYVAMMKFKGYKLVHSYYTNWIFEKIK